MSATAAPPRPAAAAQAPPASSPPRPVQIWGAIGAVLVAVEAFFLIKWVSGPNFRRVHPGATPEPSWMKTVGIAFEIGFTAAAVFSLYWFLARPWLRERAIATDGLLCVAFLLASPWDPLSTYTNDWFTYNSALLNEGSVVGELPGHLGRTGPGFGVAWSFVIASIYVSVFIWMAVLFCSLLARMQRRRPSLGPLRISAICFAMCVLADIVIEGIVNAPLGLYAFSGGHWLINGGHYYQYPIHEGIFGGAVFASFVLLRHFTNDKGETLAERGISGLAISPAKKNWLRAFAIIAAVHVGFLLTYHLPSAIFAVNTAKWPQDVVARSYFTNGICGPAVNRACPGPGVPISRPGAPYMNFAGRIVTAR